MSALEHRCPTCGTSMSSGGRCPRCAPGSDPPLTFELASEPPPPIELLSEGPPAAATLERAPDRPPPSALGPMAMPPEPAPPEPGPDPRVLELAGYDPPPGHWVLAVPYAWRVYRRRQVLRERHAAQARVRDDRRRELREELAQIVDGAVAMQDLGALLEPVIAANELVRARSQDLESSSDQHAARIAELLRSIGTLEEASKQCARERSLAQVAVEEALAQLTRAQEDERRSASLLESAHAAAREAAGRNAEFAPPEHARRITELEGELARARAARETRDQALRRAQEELRAHERAVKEAEASVDRAKAAKRAAERAAHAEREVSSAGLRDAQEKRLDAYEQTVARLHQEQPRLLSAEASARLDALRAELVELDVDLERHRLAIDAFDRPAFRRGLVLAGGAALTLLVLLVLLVRVG